MTRRLLTCGVLAGPLFLLAVAVQAAARSDFDLGRDPLSLLSHGPAGWVQVANFSVTGLLVLALAAGVARLPRPRDRGRWAAPLLGLAGVGLVMTGVFLVDAPAAGAAGAVDAAAPAVPTGHGRAHDVGTALAINPALAAALSLGRRFAAGGRPGWAAYCGASVLAGAGLAWWPDRDSTPARLALVAVVLMSWLGASAAALRQETAPPRRERA
ncbi:DUF998 domain-containing protein [Georgenia sp. AZ-5]|uniref:DUF998 domain-containing protein n=1 Tax=Georgenia sp. AZ-5 TaxID=3367526 RepID=UPI003753F930